MVGMELMRWDKYFSVEIRHARMMIAREGKMKSARSFHCAGQGVHVMGALFKNARGKRTREWRPKHNKIFSFGWFVPNNVTKERASPNCAGNMDPKKLLWQQENTLNPHF
jgi:hypothetical protein